jgi:hypothetical protein
MQAAGKGARSQANDVNMMTVKKINYEQPVKTDLLATALDNKKNSCTDDEVMEGQCIECYNLT